MGFCGLSPPSTLGRPGPGGGGSPRRATSTCAPPLVESAWSYQHRPRPVGHQKAPEAGSARDRRSSRMAQLHLCGKFRRLADTQELSQRRGHRMPANSPASCGPRWPPEMTDDRSPAPRRGDERGLHHAPGHRRSREDPRSDYATPDHSPGGDPSEGHHPAHRRPAVGTRVHQSGGPPTHLCPGAWSSSCPSPPRLLRGGRNKAAARALKTVRPRFAAGAPS